MPLLADGMRRSTGLAGAKLRARGPMEFPPERLTRMKRSIPLFVPENRVAHINRRVLPLRSTSTTPASSQEAIRQLPRSPNGACSGELKLCLEVASSWKTISSAMSTAHRSRHSRRSTQYSPVTFPSTRLPPVFVCTRRVRHRDLLHCCRIASSSVAPRDSPLLCKVPGEPTQGRRHVLRHF